MSRDDSTPASAPELQTIRRLVDDTYVCDRIIGEGAYGIVVKARHRGSGRVVAIKMFKETQDDEHTRKTGLREMRILRKLRHDNIVMLLEAFTRHGRLFLVFEFVDRAVLDDLQANASGLEPERVRDIMYQLVAAIHFCHGSGVVHRDIKPENLLLSAHGVVKLCDFGFATALRGEGATYTDYVSTRWYRSPELLVGDTAYGKPVDVWALGCLGAELATGLPLFPGDSDLGTLARVVRTMGNLPEAHAGVFRRNPLFRATALPELAAEDADPLAAKLASAEPALVDLLARCLVYDPAGRATSEDLLRHPYFDPIRLRFPAELRQRIRGDRSEAADAAEAPWEAPDGEGAAAEAWGGGAGTLSGRDVTAPGVGGEYADATAGPATGTWAGHEKGSGESSASAVASGLECAAPSGAAKAPQTAGSSFGEDDAGGLTPERSSLDVTGGGGFVVAQPGEGSGREDGQWGGAWIGVGPAVPKRGAGQSTWGGTVTVGQSDAAASSSSAVIGGGGPNAPSRRSRSQQRGRERHAAPGEASRSRSKPVRASSRRRAADRHRGDAGGQRRRDTASSVTTDASRLSDDEGLASILGGSVASLRSGAVSKGKGRGSSRARGGHDDHGSGKDNEGDDVTGATGDADSGEGGPEDEYVGEADAFEDDKEDRAGRAAPGGRDGSRGAARGSSRQQRARLRDGRVRELGLPCGRPS